MEQLKKIVESLQEFVRSYSAFVIPRKPPEIMPIKVNDREKNLQAFCEAIRDFEGFHPGSRSYRCNNPGNIRYTKFAKEDLWATGSDGVFAKWDTYEDGFNALKKFVLMASKNLLYKYHDCTIESFIKVYSPPEDNNPTERYINYVSSKVDYPRNTFLKDIV